MATKGRGDLRRGQNLYMDAPDSSFKASTLEAAGCWGVQMLDPKYLGYAPAEESPKWLLWLREEMKVNVLPKLLDAYWGTGTAEFRWLTDEGPPAVWLELLRNHWDHYAITARGAAANTFLRNCGVRCTDNSQRLLREVYLPQVAEREALAADCLPLIALDRPDAEGWKKLTAVGLGTTLDLRRYVTILKNLHRRDAASVGVADVKRIYGEIQKRMYTDVTLVRQAFAEGGLVYVLSQGQGKWVDLAHVRWTAPASLPRVAPLNDTYSELAELFVTLLQVQAATSSDVVEELLSYSGLSVEVRLVKSLLRTLNDVLSSATTDCDVAAPLLIAEAKVFPVRNAVSSIELRSAVDTSWYIADNTDLRDAFTNRVAILDFTWGETKALMPLLTKLRITTRQLSRHVREKTQLKGKSVHQQSHTAQLRSRAQYIACLVEQRRYEDVSRRLRDLEVLSVPTLTIRRWVVVDSQIVYGKDDVGEASLQTEDGVLRLYISEAVATSGGLPEALLTDLLMGNLHIPADKQFLLLRILIARSSAEIRSVLEKEDLLREDASAVIDTAEATVMTDGSSIDASALVDPAKLGSETLSDAQASALPPLIVGGRQAGSRAPTHDSEMSGRQPKGRRGNGEAKDAASTSSAGSITAQAKALSLESSTGAVGSGNGRRMSNLSVNPSVSSRQHENHAVALNGSHDYVAVQPEADEHQQSTGSDGELMVSNITASSMSVRSLHTVTYVYELLKSKFGIGIECWTSDVRTQHGFPALDEFEGLYSDFTISDQKACELITAWLTEANHTEVGKGTNGFVVYHIEVRATSGSRSEAFSMSTNQYNQALQWHNSEHDIYVVLRLYNMGGKAKLCAYVDPFALKQAGTLTFTAQSGYYVQPC